MWASEGAHGAESGKKRCWDAGDRGTGFLRGGRWPLLGSDATRAPGWGGAMIMAVVVVVVVMKCDQCCDGCGRRAAKRKVPPHFLFFAHVETGSIL